MLVVHLGTRRHQAEQVDAYETLHEMHDVDVGEAELVGGEPGRLLRRATHALDYLGQARNRRLEILRRKGQACARLLAHPCLHHPPPRRRSAQPREVAVVTRRGAVDEHDVVREADVFRFAEMDQVVVDDLAQQLVVVDEAVGGARDRVP